MGTGAGTPGGAAGTDGALADDAPADGALGVVTGVARRMACSAEPASRVTAMLEVVAGAVEAELAVVVQADPSHTVVEVVGGELTPSAREGLAGALLPLSRDDPLLAPVAAGHLEPRSGARAFGSDRWHRSAQRAGCVEHGGVGEVSTLPLSGGPDFVVALLGRRGPDFSDEELALLGELRPAVAAMAVLAGLRPLPWPGSRPRLTERERQVLDLLAEGYTAARIGRELGTSPRTVEVHLRRIYGKLDATDRLTAVLRAYDLELIPPRGSESFIGTT